MKYLVIGGTGFLGAHICRQLMARGDEVICMGSRPITSASPVALLLTDEEMDKMTKVTADMSDYMQVVRVVKENAPDKIITTAAMLLDACEKDIPAAIRVNILGMINIFEAARLCGIKRVVYASSDSSMGPVSLFGDTPVGTDFQHQPNCLYGMTKFMDEFIGKMFNEKYGMETVGLRYTTIYGKARVRGGANWTKALINDVALGKDSKVPNGDTAPNVIYVKDAARVAILAADADASKLTRHAYAASGDVATVKEMREYVLTLISDVNIELLPGKVDCAPIKYDTTIEERDLGYKFRYTYKDGIREAINEIREEAGMEPV